MTALAAEVRSGDIYERNCNPGAQLIFVGVMYGLKRTLQIPGLKSETWAPFGFIHRVVDGGGGMGF
jgi:hypothetical protein